MGVADDKSYKVGQADGRNLILWKAYQRPFSKFSCLQLKWFLEANLKPLWTPGNLHYPKRWRERGFYNLLGSVMCFTISEYIPLGSPLFFIYKSPWMGFNIFALTQFTEEMKANNLHKNSPAYVQSYAIIVQLFLYKVICHKFIHLSS